MRPAASARVRLGELGLIPFRPSLAAAIIDPTAAVDPSDGLAYLPPERVLSPDRTQAGDIYGLGATLYFLLTGKPPHEAERVGDLVERIQHREPPPLAGLRPDCPPSLLEAIRRMMARDPSARPSASDVVGLLSSASPPLPDDQPPAPIQPPPTLRQEIVVGPGPNVEVDLSDPVAPRLPLPGHLLPGPGAAKLPIPGAGPMEPTPAPSPAAAGEPPPGAGGWIAAPYSGSPGYPAPGGYAATGAVPFPHPIAGAYPAAAVPFPHPGAGAYPPMGYSAEAYPGYPPGGGTWNPPLESQSSADFTASHSPGSFSSSGLTSGAGGKSRGWLIWVIVGAVLNLIAIAGWVYLFSGAGQSESPKKPPVKQRR